MRFRAFWEGFIIEKAIKGYAFWFLAGIMCAALILGCYIFWTASGVDTSKTDGVLTEGIKHADATISGIEERDTYYRGEVKTVYVQTARGIVALSGDALLERALERCERIRRTLDAANSEDFRGLPTE